MVEGRWRAVKVDPVINGSFAKNDLQLEASFGSSPPYIAKSNGGGQMEGREGRRKSHAHSLFISYITTLSERDDK